MDSWMRKTVPDLALAISAVRSRLTQAVDFLPTRRWRIEHTAAEVDEVPPEIPRRRAYLVTTATRKKWLVFDCPCRTGHRLMINLDQTRQPYWHIVLSRSKLITLSPSIDFRDEHRRCHYVVRRGRIMWADGGSGPYHLILYYNRRYGERDRVERGRASRAH